MITDSYDKATSELSHHHPPHGYWGALQQIWLGGRSFYRAVVSPKCKRCRKMTRQQSRFAPCAPNVGGNCPICGNPYYHIHRHRRVRKGDRWEFAPDHGSVVHWQMIKGH